MNDISTGSPAAAPPASAPAGSSAPPAASETSTTSTADWGKLFAPDRVDAGAEHLHEKLGHSRDSDSETDSSDEPDGSDDQRRGTTRNERRERRAELRLLKRLQAAAEQKNAEAAESREPGTAEDEGGDEAAPEAAQQYDDDPEMQEAARQQQRQREHTEAHAKGAYDARALQFAEQVPDFRDVVQNISEVDVPEHVLGLLRASRHGPRIVYELGASIQGLNVLMKVKEMSPMEAAYFIGRSEQAIEASGYQQRAPAAQSQRRLVTKARPPIVPLRGGAGGSSLHELVGTGMRVPQHFAERIMKGRR